MSCNHTRQHPRIGELPRRGDHGDLGTVNWAAAQFVQNKRMRVTRPNQSNLLLGYGQRPASINDLISPRDVPATIRPNSASPRKTKSVERRGMLRDCVTM